MEIPFGTDWELTSIRSLLTRRSARSTPITAMAACAPMETSEGMSPEPSLYACPRRFIDEFRERCVRGVEQRVQSLIHPYRLDPVARSPVVRRPVIPVHAAKERVSSPRQLADQMLRAHPRCSLPK
jgi:hypothetical protein